MFATYSPPTHFLLTSYWSSTPRARHARSSCGHRRGRGSRCAFGHRSHITVRSRDGHGCVQRAGSAEKRGPKHVSVRGNGCGGGEARSAGRCDSLRSGPIVYDKLGRAEGAAGRRTQSPIFQDPVSFGTLRRYGHLRSVGIMPIPTQRYRYDSFESSADREIRSRSSGRLTWRKGLEAWRYVNSSAAGAYHACQNRYTLRNWGWCRDAERIATPSPSSMRSGRMLTALGSVAHNLRCSPFFLREP